LVAAHHVDPVLMAALFAVVPILGTGLTTFGYWQVVRGRLERNQYVGLRTPSTMHNDAAWLAGHRAALRLSGWTLLVAAATCAALWAAALRGSTTIVVLVGIIGLVAFLTVIIVVAVVASRAARSAGGRAEPVGVLHRDVMAKVEAAEPMSRATPLIGVIVAAGMFVLTALLLVSIVHGYLSALHHQLPPDADFGFRDATTRSSPAAWYAAQQAGFKWLLIGGGPILAANLVSCVAAAVKRQPFWASLGTTLLTVVLLTIVLVVAGIHADGVARAVGS
jgi:SdpI/YfhL protein family